MELTPTFLDQCESAVADGKTSKTIDQLLDVASQTAYRNEIISLSNRSKLFSREQMSRMLSHDQQTLKQNRLNNDTLRLITALRGELAGEEVIAELFQEENQDVAHKRGFPLMYLLMAMGLTAAAVGGISFAVLKPEAPVCNEDINLNGNWLILNGTSVEEEELGSLRLSQENCMVYFSLSGTLRSATIDSMEEIDFSSRIGGINDEEIVFVYENFAGEIGVCRGVAPSVKEDEFKVHCIDLAGYDKNGEERYQMIFRKIDE